MVTAMPSTGARRLAYAEGTSLRCATGGLLGWMTDVQRLLSCISALRAGGWR
jgi:hypothetical protein